MSTIDINDVILRGRVLRSAYLHQLGQRGIAFASALTSRAFAAVQRWRLNRRAYSELSALDDRMLSDIGLSRAEIMAAVNGELRNRPAQPANENLRDRRERPANNNSPSFAA